MDWARSFVQRLPILNYFTCRIYQLQNYWNSVCIQSIRLRLHIGVQGQVCGLPQLFFVLSFRLLRIRFLKHFTEV